MNGVRVLCPAKINLTLEILGKRPDGYHELRTLFQAVGLYDELTIRPAEEDSLTVTGLPGAPTDERNLCVQAARLWREEAIRTAPVAIELHKRIPLQAGLGGGSSDAAGVLAGMEALAGGGGHGTGRPTRLRAMAARLGSDVAFFLRGGAMIGSGRGEVLEAAQGLGQGAFVLAKPEVAVSTAEAYGLIGPGEYTDGSYTAALAACLAGETPAPRGLAGGCGLPEVAAKMYNAFAQPVSAHWPAVAAVQTRLQSLQAQGVLLCGSGSAVFGLFSDMGPAEAAAEALRGEGLWAVAVRPVSCDTCVSHGVQVTEL
jgi:4-diphosphocytidyl-2-C-methyl-D-erythritol kinase